MGPPNSPSPGHEETHWLSCLAAKATKEAAAAAAEFQWGVARSRSVASGPEVRPLRKVNNAFCLTFLSTFSVEIGRPGPLPLVRVMRKRTRWRRA